MSAELPDGWTVCQLGEVVTVLDSQRVPVSSAEREMRRGAIPYYGATGQVGWINDFLFDEELLLLGEDGAPFFDKSKSIAYIVQGKSWVNNHAHVLRARGEVTTNRFLKYVLEAVNFDGFVNGTTRLKLTQSAMVSIPVNLPPLAEQNRIVEKVEALLAQVDTAKERLDRVLLILKRFRQAVLAAACSGTLTEEWRKDTLVPSLEDTLNARRRSVKVKRAAPVTADYPDVPGRWTWCWLSELGELGRGKSRHRPRNDPKLYGGAYPFIQTGDVARSSGVIDRHSQTYSEFGLAQSRLWPAKTVCITIAANIANSAILAYPACFPDSVVGLVADPSVCVPEYVHFFMCTARSALLQYAPATAQKNINLEILGDVAVPLPPLEEQQEIARRVDVLFSVADAVEERFMEAQRRIEKLPQSILAKAFKGELVPTEAELARAEGRTYETAEQLLARIRSSPVTEPAKRTRRKSGAKGERSA